MNSEELKELISSSIEPLLQRITALENDNQQIKALLKNVPQPKVPVKPISTTSASSTLIENLDIKKLPPTSSKNLENEKNVGLPKKQENGADNNLTPSNHKKQPITKPVNPTTAVKRPVTAQTPQSEKKPVTNPTGRVSIGADKHKPLIKPAINSNHPEKQGPKNDPDHETKTQKKQTQVPKQKNGTSKGGLAPHKVEPTKNKTSTSNKNLKTQTAEKVQKKQQEKIENQQKKQQKVEVQETKVQVPEPVQPTELNVQQKQAQSTVEKGEKSQDHTLENDEKHEQQTGDNLDETAGKGIPQRQKQLQAEEQQVSS